MAQLPKPEDPASLGQDAALCLYRASKLAGLLLETALKMRFHRSSSIVGRRHRGNDIAVAAQESGLARDAVHRPLRQAIPHHAQAKSANGVKGECLKMYLTSEIVKDTLAARRFRLLAPLALLLALVALTLAPSIIGIR